MLPRSTDCEHTNLAIVGAGPTGIGAALRLLELGETDFLLIDAAEAPGGLASSCVDEQGFTWDLGGHVQFSHYQKFDEYMDLAFPAEGWLWHERESWIWLKDRFIPYPFQNNLHRLDAGDRWRAMQGLIAAAALHKAPENFEQWILATFGAGIAELFMVPYNRKVWAHPLGEMDFRWVGERVAVPSIEQAMKSICLNEDQVSWGPNRRFRFPLHGGTGSIWRSLGARIPQANLRMGTRVDRIDAGRRILTANGQQIRYENLINTAPLNWLTRAIGDAGLDARAGELKSSTVHVVGIGLKGAPPESIRKMCWMYFPGAESNFYRVTVFSNYSPHNVPSPGSTWSLMAEVSESEHAPRDRARVVEDVVSEMAAIGLIRDREDIVSRWHKVLTPGYPTPSLERNAILADTLPALESKNIFSRGRFGAWKYEVSNQDHSFMQGVEVIDRILYGRAEPTLEQPDLINQRYNPFPYAEWEAA
jgi:protoporphyrinogen oxidase